MTTIGKAGALVAVLAAAATGAAFAENATTKPGVTGVVQSVDPGTRAVVLDDGRTYHMRKDADVSILGKGVSVALACDTNGANCMVITSGPPNDAIPANPQAGGNIGTGEGSD
jgi:hypothetical protein